MYKATLVAHPRFSLPYRRPILPDGPTVHHLGHSVYVGYLDHPGHPGYPVPIPVTQSALQGRVYHHFGIFVTCLQSYFFNVKRGSDSLH